MDGGKEGYAPCNISLLDGGKEGHARCDVLWLWMGARKVMLAVMYYNCGWGQGRASSL